MFSYRSILKQAWVISWKHKYLWFFGLFASLAVAGGTMEYQFASHGLGQGLINGSFDKLDGLLAASIILQALWSGIVNLFNQNIFIILNTFSVTLLLLTFLVVFVWLAISSQAALVDNVKKIINAKKNLDISSIREGLTIGSRHFWPVLGLNILIKLLIGFCFFIISLPLLLMTLNDSSWFIVLYTIFFVIFIPIAVSLSLVVKYAISYQVLENKSFVISLEHAWRLFKKNWLISLETALLLFAINFLASFLLLLILFILFFPLILVSLLFSLTWLMFILFGLSLLVTVAFGSLLTTFQVSAWTDLFLNLRENQGLAKLERFFSRK